jgi:hypothetical protein
MGLRSEQIRTLTDDGLNAQGTASRPFVVSMAAPATAVTAKLFAYIDLAAAGVNVHAAVAGTAATAFAAPFTSPALPRSLQYVFAASYDGGDITVTGTDQFDAVITETVTAVAASTVQGTKVFKTVTAVSRSTTGVNAATVTVQTGTKIGIAGAVQGAYGILQTDNAVEAVTVDSTYSGFVPTTVPNGAHDYVLCVNVTHTHAAA